MISFLKALLMNLSLPPLFCELGQCSSPWHKSRAKALLSFSEADDDYVVASFTSLEASSKSLCAMVFLLSPYSDVFVVVPLFALMLGRVVIVGFHLP